MGEMTNPAKTISGSRPFEAVLESYQDEILAYLWRIFSGSPEADDCFQETFLRAFRAYPELDPDANQRAWLYRIATNVARSHFKSNHRRTEREQRSALPGIPGVDPTHDRVQNRLLWKRVTGWIMDLPFKQRAAFMLRKYHGCSYAEIGESINCSPEAARANVYQALKKLKAIAGNHEVDNL
jgi:RNA polymerase sigma factor (sigma-70 family)